MAAAATAMAAVRVSAEKAKNPARLDGIRIYVEYPHRVDARHYEGLDKAVRSCLIHNTLLHPPKITTEIEGAPKPVALAVRTSCCVNVLEPL